MQCSYILRFYRFLHNEITKFNWFNIMKDNIKSFKLSNVRCFEHTNEFQLRPFTFLMGSNSTGKSTVLGCIQALGDFLNLSESRLTKLDFNVPPYGMGAFDDIVRNERTDKFEQFEIGFDFALGKSESAELTVKLRGTDTGSEPVFSSLNMIFSDFDMVWTKSNGPIKNKHSLFENFALETKKKNDKIIFEFKVPKELNIEAYLLIYRFMIETIDSDSSTTAYSDNLLKLRKYLNNTESKVTANFKSKDLDKDPLKLHYSFFPPFSNFHFHSFAPIRTKPQRIYNPTNETEDPEGNEMAMTLNNLSRSKPSEWKILRDQLEMFGKNSKLFEKLIVKNFGKSFIDPFQIQLAVQKGPNVNLSDVGYGVSQVLPILVRILRTGNHSTTFLMQQPELHLHPMGQAEFISTLNEIQKTYSHSYIIETHSDYMIDRARIEIMNGNLRPEDVSLIYFEPEGTKVKIDNIQFDDQANLINEPPYFRSFFLNETHRLLGFQK